MDLTNTCILVEHLKEYLDSREHPGQLVTVYLDSLHPHCDDQTLEDLIRSSVTELNDFLQRQGDLVLCRSDCGDGGWSLHPAGSTDEQIASGDAPVLVSGTAQWADGDWDRPNAQDYASARGEGGR
jgi:hypothetical protein